MNPYAAITIEQMEREASRARTAMDLPRGTQDLAPWRDALRAEAERQKDADNAR